MPCVEPLVRLSSSCLAHGRVSSRPFHDPRARSHLPPAPTLHLSTGPRYGVPCPVSSPGPALSSQLLLCASVLSPGPDPQDRPRGRFSQQSRFALADRGKVLGGLPDVVTIMEGKVRAGNGVPREGGRSGGVPTAGPVPAAGVEGGVLGPAGPRLPLGNLCPQRRE